MSAPTAEDQIGHHPEHAESMSGHARQQAVSFRTYLTWATDPPLIAWATGMVAAAELEAEAYEHLAAAIRERHGVPA